MKTVLVADGPANARELLRVLLEHEGYQVLEAANADEAVSMARAERPDLIFLDVEAPDSGGCATVREMRREQRLKDRIIIAVTSNTRRADREEMINAGFTGCIAKPVILRTLREQLCEIAAWQPEGTI